ncbi:MAG: hypothetical protein JNG84_02905 [Archangium sp.]|nr:hypothetical protein [Archangium sp.]
MKLLALAVITLSTLFTTGCGTSPLDACKGRVAADCKKMWSCPGVSVKLGNDEASCTSSGEALCTLATSGTCKNGPYDTAATTGCTADIQAASCEQYTAGTFAMANCDKSTCEL